jgi:hypothetical protein
MYVECKGAWRNVRLGLEGQNDDRSLGGPRRRWEDSIKMDLRERGSGGMDWIDLAQDSNQ